MKCIIPGGNVKVFGRAVHSLSKIGDELYVEPLDNGFALRTVNSSRSAYACFLFHPSFFLTYVRPQSQPQNGQEQDEEDVVRCKVTMKSCLSVFRSLSTLEKTVERCHVTLNMAEARLVFQMHCRHGIVKTYNLAFIECETLQAVYSKDLTPNCLVAQAKLLWEAVQNFPTNQEEVTLSLSPSKVILRNFVSDEPEPNKAMRTEVTLYEEEFEEFQVGVDTEVTFCLKEFRALLAFAEPANLPLSTRLETAGRPIVLSLDSDPTFETNLVLATLADVTSATQTGSCSQMSSQAPSIADASEYTNTSTASRLTRRTRMQPDTYVPPVPSRVTESRVPPTGQGEHNVPVSRPSHDVSTTDVARSRDTDKSGAPDSTAAQDSTIQRADEAGRCSDGDDDDEWNDTVPGTPPPPPKKFKSSLFVCSQESVAAKASVVLAPDSDSDN